MQLCVIIPYFSISLWELQNIIIRSNASNYFTSFFVEKYLFIPNRNCLRMILVNFGLILSLDDLRAAKFRWPLAFVKNKFR